MLLTPCARKGTRNFGSAVRTGRFCGPRFRFAEPANGEGTLRIAVLRDLARREAAETVLLEREERLRSILDTVPDAIIVIDERGLIELLSRAAERLFGYTAAEAIGQNVRS